MATTENTASGNGQQDSFSFTFPYLKDTDIKVSVGGVVKTVTTHYTLHTPTTIKFTSGNIPPSGTNNVRIYRETSDTALQATFYPGSAIRSGDLNDNFTQNLYVTQESNNDSTLALNNSRESDGAGSYTSAIDKATAATTTANTASANATTAVNTANTASATATTASNNASAAVTSASNANNTAASAVTTANAATTTANSAVTTANGADTKADTAIATANTASTNATTAVNTANAATTTANAATTTANAASATANTASSDATTAVNTANTASTNASNAVTTANAADTNATTALNNSRVSDGAGGYISAITRATSASTTATNANTTATAAQLATDRLVATTSNGGATWTLAGNNTNASTDPKGVGYAITTAEAASATATAAQSAVANSVLYTPYAAVANIPGSPSNNDYIEILDSTGIESFSPLAGLPSGFTGDAGLTVKLKYTTSGSTWNYQSYHTNDSEDRYVATYGKHNTTQVSYTVKVVSKTAAHRYHNVGSSSGFTIGGIEAPFLTLIPGNTYRFDQSDSSNSNHPIAFYRQPDKSGGAWTTGVTSNGTPGQVGAYTDLVVSDTTPFSLSYQCQNHAHMGNGTATNTGAGGSGATGGGGDEIFIENDQNVTVSYSISANKNAQSIGPIGINNSIVVTIPNNSTWVIN